MTRNRDALLDYIAAHIRTPFAWGEHDCVTFAQGAVAVQTGTDPLFGVRLWKGMKGAAGELKRRGGFFEALSSRLDEIPPAMAQRGDIALVVTPGLGALMVVEGETLVGPGEAGLVRMPRSEMIAAWDAGSVER